MKKEKIIIFILVILLIFICINIHKKETFNTNGYNVILTNHKNYQIIIADNINKADRKIYKIYKN